MRPRVFVLLRSLVVLNCELFEMFCAIVTENNKHFDCSPLSSAWNGERALPPRDRRSIRPRGREESHYVTRPFCGPTSPPLLQPSEPHRRHERKGVKTSCHSRISYQRTDRRRRLFSVSIVNNMRAPVLHNLVPNMQTASTEQPTPSSTWLRPAKLWH